MQWHHYVPKCLIELILVVFYSMYSVSLYWDVTQKPENVSLNVKTLLSATRTSSQVTFPVDFFEHNQQLTEVEFGGNDLLQVYNGQQIKHRLNSTGMYVANTKVQHLHDDSILMSLWYIC